MQRTYANLHVYRMPLWLIAIAAVMLLPLLSGFTFVPQGPADSPGGDVIPQPLVPASAGGSAQPSSTGQHIVTFQTMNDWNNYQSLPFRGWSTLLNDWRHSTDGIAPVANPDPSGLNQAEVLQFSIQNQPGALSKAEGIVIFNNTEAQVVDWEAWYYIPEGLEIVDPGLGWEQMLIMQLEANASDGIKGPMWAVNLMDNNSSSFAMNLLHYPNMPEAAVFNTNVTVPKGEWFQLRARVSYRETTSFQLWLNGQPVNLQTGDGMAPVDLPVVGHSNHAALVDLYTSGLRMNGQDGGCIYVGPVSLYQVE
jgi:hypothetical protein